MSIEGQDLTECLEEIESLLGCRFKDLKLLEQAFTHKSYAHENIQSLPPGKVLFHNEKLEFLGDAVLELVVSEHIYDLLEAFDEGELSKLRAALVNEDTLADVARRLRIGRFLRLGRGEEKTGGREKSSILGNVIEALVAAIHLDQGPEVARSWIEKNILTFDLEKEAEQLMRDFDPKTRLQELAQVHFRSVPSYQIVGAVGPDHDKRFQIELELGKKERIFSEGRSKKQAEQKAAQKALKHYFEGDFLKSSLKENREG